MRITVGEVDPPLLNFFRGHFSRLLNLDPTSDAVFTSTSNVSRDTSSADADQAEDDDGELQGIINFPPPHNDYNCGAIREELDSIVESTTSNKVNIKKVIHSFVVDS